MEWLCPGWEDCASPNEECTTSRCCASPEYGCFLNQTLLEAGGGWHAFCELPSLQKFGSQGRVQLHQVATGEQLDISNPPDSNMTDEEYFYLQVSTKHAFCEGTPEWRCLESWQAEASRVLLAANQKARYIFHSSGLHPAAIVGIVLGSVLLACCACIGAVVYRRRMAAHLKKLEAELAGFRQATREATEKKRGGEHVAALVNEDGAKHDEDDGL